MFMTDTEITGSFRRADNKMEQLKILSELNATSKDAIRDVLRKNGIPEEEIPKDPPKKERSKPKVKAKAEPKAEKHTGKFAIPDAVRHLCTARIQFLTDFIKELEEEKNALKDYLRGANVNG